MSSAGAAAPTDTTAPSCLIVVMPQMSWQGLRAAGMPKIEALLKDSAVGLMPVASPEEPHANRTWVTLGAGRGAVGSDVRGEMPAGGGFRVDVEALLDAERDARTRVRPGLLGEMLHARGLTTALIAYGLWEGGKLPPSVTVVMDTDGRIDGGGVYEPLGMSGLGKQLDTNAVGDAVLTALSKYDVVLLDLTGVGPTEHVEDIVFNMARVTSERESALFLLTALSPAAVPGRVRDAGFMAMLAPGASPGLLSSATTRWPGLVAASDFAPTLLGSCSGDNASSLSREIDGHRAHSTPSKGVLAGLDRRAALLTQRDVVRETAARLYAVLMGFLLAVALWFLRGDSEHCPRLAMLALVSALFPVGLLIAPAVSMDTLPQMVAALGIALALGRVVGRLPRATQTVAAGMLFGAAVIALDVLFGSSLMRRSALGFSALSGSRFYGIGNEYAGALCAMTTIGLGALLQETRRFRATILMGAMVALVVGAPWWGANWGAYVALCAGLIAVWVAVGGHKARRALLGATALAAAACVPPLVDLLNPMAERSHLGAAAVALLDGRAAVLADIAWRKVVMNFRIAAQGGWWWAATPVAFVAAWAMLRRGGMTRRALDGQPYLTAGFWGAWVSALVALIVNDSGIVAAATGLAVTMSGVVFMGAKKK